jgi:hypothetical protein
MHLLLFEIHIIQIKFAYYCHRDPNALCVYNTRARKLQQS